MSADTVARLHIVLNDIEPAIWRRVDVPVTASLKMLHDIVQAAMGWENCHLWHFEVGDQRYGVPDPMWPDSCTAAAKNVKLAALIDRGSREFLYTYDMGDDWRHTITVETVGPGEPEVKYPRFVAGEQRCPPEDVGGLPGFELFLDAMAEPAHEDHDRPARLVWRPLQRRRHRRTLHPTCRSRHRHPPSRRQTRLPEKPPVITRRPAGHAYGDSCLSHSATTRTLQATAVLLDEIRELE